MGNKFSGVSMQNNLWESLKLHRDNLVKLIMEDAPSNKFIAELIEVREIILKLNFKVSYRLNSALSHAFSDYQYPSKYIRSLMISEVVGLIEEIGNILSSSKQVILPKLIPSDFPKYEDLLSERAIVDCFIQHGPLSGIWFKEFPVGLKKVIEKADEERKKGNFEWISEEKFGNLFSGICQHVDLILLESAHNKVVERIPEKDILLLYKNYPEDLFAGKSVYLIEAKKSKEDIPKAVEQILQYKTLFQEDWPTSKVNGIGIICKEWADPELSLCKKNNIITWEVTCQEVRYRK